MKKRSGFLINFITYTFLFSIFTSNIAFASDTVNSILKDVAQVLLVVAGLVCIGKLVHIGILFMTSSAAEKSNAKMAVIPWLVGTIVCFGASWIGPAIINIIKTGDGSVLDSY